jgi:hypothetical protein
MFIIRLAAVALLAATVSAMAHKEAEKCPYVVRLEKRLADLEARVASLEKPQGPTRPLRKTPPFNHPKMGRLNQLRGHQNDNNAADIH